MSAPDDGPPITVTRPDRDGRPTELLELGQEDQRELPRWAKLSLVGVVALAVVLSVGSDLLDRWQAHRLAERQADALQLAPGQSGGGTVGGQVQFTVGLRNDGPLPVRLRDPRLTAPGLEGIVGVTAPETVAPGAQADLVVTVDAVCPPADLTATRVVVAVTAVAPSGRERRIELDVTALPGLLEAACREPSPADDLLVEVASARRVGAALRVAVRLSTGSGAEGELVSVASPLFAVSGLSGPVIVLGSGSIEIELVLSRPVCRAAEPLPGGGGLRLPVDFVLRAVTDRSGAGDGQGPRPDGSQPDLDESGPGLVVGRDLAVDGGPAGERLALLAEQLVTSACS